MSQRVTGGQPVSLSSYPAVTWQVALEITFPNGQGLCGGSIVDSLHVLTAAHCIKELSDNSYVNPANIRLLPGIRRDDNSATGNRQAEIIWADPTYVSSASAAQIDLAIIKVSEPFDFNSEVQPIPMCSGSSCFSPAGSNLFVSGYGQTISDQSSSVSEVLMWAPLTAVSQSTCEARWNSNFQCSTSCFPVTNVCAASDPATAGRDSCFGDSGGPLVRNFGTLEAPVFQQVGVVSSGTVPASQSPSCGRTGDYGVYVSVAQNRAWIDSVIAGERNAQGITSDCLATGQCAGSSGGGSSGSNVNYYYVVVGSLAAVVLLVMLLMCVVRNCRRRYLTTANRAEMVHEPSYVMERPASTINIHPPPQQQQQTSYPPAASAPPPVYQQPVYQNPEPQQMYNPELLPHQSYSADPQAYGQPPPNSPPPATAPAPYPQPGPSPPSNPYLNPYVAGNETL